ncbi:MAG TPA: helix-turn-helix domain-containing protein [Acidimicrobiales bacterium]
MTSGTLDAEVALVRWPGEAARRNELARCGRPRLLVVALGEVPPADPDGLEDWVRDGGDAVEVYLRKERLRRRQAARAPAVLDADGLLHRGDRWVALSRRELDLARVLLARPGTLVSRAELLGALCPGVEVDDRRLLDTLARRVHRRISPLGLAVHTVRGSGLLLQLGDLPA